MSVTGGMANTVSDGQVWRVVDDLAPDYSVTGAELGAVEAFLMPLIHSWLAGGSDIQSGKTTSNAAPLPLPQ